MSNPYPIEYLRGYLDALRNSRTSEPTNPDYERGYTDAVHDIQLTRKIDNAEQKQGDGNGREGRGT